MHSVAAGSGARSSRKHCAQSRDFGLGGVVRRRGILEFLNRGGRCSSLAHRISSSLCCISGAFSYNSSMKSGGNILCHYNHLRLKRTLSGCDCTAKKAPAEAKHVAIMHFGAKAVMMDAPTVGEGRTCTSLGLLSSGLLQG
jgi:hypothetical protein